MIDLTILESMADPCAESAARHNAHFAREAFSVHTVWLTTRP